MASWTPYTELQSAKAWFIEKHLSALSHPLKTSVEKLVLTSDYACRHIGLLLELLQQDACCDVLSRETYFHDVNNLRYDATYPQALRRFRHRQFLRILLLQTAELAGTEELMRAWSDCADAIILHALRYCQETVAARYGEARDDSGKAVELFVLAMGKLGGRELNYSSDVDLIFAYGDVSLRHDAESVSAPVYFNKVIQQFVQLLGAITEDGFVFRVDLRLRPNGDSGPLVSSVTAMETYYQEQGRDWERYAMVKARVIEPSLDNSCQWFERLIRPFVYRRYVDFSVIESLRSMKALIEREVELNPRLDDIKRGKGGIREVEFVIQNLQLIRGGRLPQLQQQNALLALQALKKEHLLQRSDALKQAYLYLRRLENIIQAINDQQTHSLPDDPLKQAQVMLAMGYTSWDELLHQLQQYQRIISYAFHHVMAKSDAYIDDDRMLANQLTSLWQGHIEQGMAVNLLTILGFENAEYCYHMIYAFRHSPRCRRLSQAARMRLDRFMVLLLAELGKFAKTDEVLLHVIRLLENIVGRSAYLALLTENPQALHELLLWFANSVFISALLEQQPFLLEVLLDQQNDWRPLSRAQLVSTLKEKLSHAATDIEQQEEILRQFKLTMWLMAARAELYAGISAVRIGQFLSDVAQVIVEQVVNIARQQSGSEAPEISLIAYGKLGAREMNFTSDLDLVFLHREKPEKEASVTRLAQKIVRMLTTRTQSGILYAVDTRLRPSGTAGLLVSPLDAFIAYQQEQAWTWEHQALLKARVITGDRRIRQAFMELKKSILSVQRNTSALQQEVVRMREKINQHQSPDPVKHAKGGLLDLEFLIQFLILNLANPALARYTHTASHLQQLTQARVLNPAQSTQLKKAYTQYHHLLHRQILSQEQVIDESTQQEVSRIYTMFLHGRRSGAPPDIL